MSTVVSCSQAGRYDCRVNVGEKKLIAEIRRMAAHDRRNALSVVAGIGDDCAVLRVPPRHEALVTTDFSLEGMHFRRDWHSPESVGHRCLARGLSDIAAMGGAPIAAFLSLALPRDVSSGWVGRFMHGLLELAKRYGVTLAGGDTSESPDRILADIVVVGSVPRGRAVMRSGAKIGDRIYVSGNLGGSAAAVRTMESGKKPPVSGHERHFFPQPRVELGRLLRERHLVTAMIDTSDGLSTDLAHICDESGVGAEIFPDQVPRAQINRQVVDLELALHGGEDYELLFTSAKKVPTRIGSVALTEIGSITGGSRMWLRDGTRKKKFEVRGWEHFQARRK
jgi:thiamine-monophosphate kinase